MVVKRSPLYYLLTSLLQLLVQHSSSSAGCFHDGDLLVPLLMSPAVPIPTTVIFIRQKKKEKSNSNSMAPRADKEKHLKITIKKKINPGVCPAGKQNLTQYEMLNLDIMEDVIPICSEEWKKGYYMMIFQIILYTRLFYIEFTVPGINSFYNLKQSFQKHL